MRITPPQRRRWTGWRRSSKPPFLLRFYYFSTPSEAPKCHDMRGIFRNAKCRKCMIFQAIPSFSKWCKDNQKIGRTFLKEVFFGGVDLYMGQFLCFQRTAGEMGIQQSGKVEYSCREGQNGSRPAIIFTHCVILTSSLLSKSTVLIIRLCGRSTGFLLFICLLT